MMRSLWPVVLLALLVLLAGLPAARDPREPDVFCGACRALMDEVEYDVTKARQEKTKVGSFRINPDGTQERRKEENCFNPIDIASPVKGAQIFTALDAVGEWNSESRSTSASGVDCGRRVSRAS
ncbi:hypothetical protein MG293_006054 [Ovis ammon polii]|uniref:DUF3456 domain-containing protein n=1 Tax=Ovis ammon polii TaxID=230172 RepID=A0AAD4UGJ8_OVIAM|nr:hypothetical protein MG293_006054 [Ovis ammon polii]